MANDLPKKLKHDAIVEVTFEIRFEVDPSAVVPELLVGRIADTPSWRGFQPRRMPGADIPPALRRADPNLRYLSSIQLIAPSGVQLVGIGPNSLSYTRQAPYPGWDGQFGEEVERTVDALFEVLPDVPISRLGLRYINALTSTWHGIDGIESLNLRVALGDEMLIRRLNLNYTVPVLPNSSCTVRIASVDLAQGMIPQDATVIADLDVYTDDGFFVSGVETVKIWLADAHREEKGQFFKLLTDETIDRLRAL